MTSPDKMRSWKISFIIVWKVVGELVKPKYITRGSKSPRFVRKAAFHSSPSQMRTLLKPQRMSSFVKNRAPFNRLIRSLIKGSGYRFFTVIALSAR